MGCCMYKDKIYVIDGRHNVPIANGSLLTDGILYIIDTLNYTIEKITDFVIKTSGIDSPWTVPADSSSNLTKNAIQTVTYASLFGYNDKIYFIPYAQQDIGVFDSKTRTFDQTTYNLGYPGGFYGFVYNPTNKCLYMSRTYKVGSTAGWNIPYLDFSSTTPTLGAVALPSNYVGFRGGAYCHTNGCVYIPMDITNNGANGYVLKISSTNVASALTLGGAATDKTFNSCLYTPADRITLHSGGVLYRIKPSDDSLDCNITITSGRFPMTIDRYGTLYSFSQNEGNSYGVYKFPILVNNKEIFNPTFNHMN